MIDEKIGLTVEDVSDVSMAFSLFDQDDQGLIDLESLEAALFQISEGEEGSTFIPPVRRLKEKGELAPLETLVDESLISEEDFENYAGMKKVFALFDTSDEGYVDREDFFEVIDALLELGLV